MIGKGLWAARDFGQLTSVWANEQVVHPVPACPDRGTPFTKTHEYPNLLSFEANCMDKHDPELLGHAAEQN